MRRAKGMFDAAHSRSGSITTGAAVPACGDWTFVFACNDARDSSGLSQTVPVHFSVVTSNAVHPKLPIDLA